MREASSAAAFDRQPMVWLAVAFAGGILLGNFFDLPLTATAATSIGIGALAFVLRSRSTATFLILSSFVAAGAASIAVSHRPPSPDRLKAIYDTGEIKPADRVELEGVLLAPPELSTDGSFLTLRAEKIAVRGTTRDVSGRVRLSVPSSDEPLDLHYGSRIRVACTLSRDDRYLDPGVEPVKEVLDREDVDVTGSVKSQLLIEKIADESVFLPLAWVFDERAALAGALRRQLEPRTAGVLIAATLGDRYFLDKQTADLFRDGGTFHFLVIAGLHTTFVGGIFLFLVRRFTRSRWLQFLLTISFLWTYALAVGAGIPVVRAATMFTIVLFSYVVYRPVSLLNTLGMCGLVLLVWRPADLFDPSFQLTLAAVAAIVAIAFPLVEKLRRIGAWSPDAARPFPPSVPTALRRVCETIFWNAEAWPIEMNRQIWSARIFKAPYLEGKIRRVWQKALRWLAEGLLVSAVVQLTILPLSVIYFHRLSFSGALLNLWVGPLIAVESLAALVGVAVSHIGAWLAVPFLTIAEALNWLMLAAPRLFADNGWASFRLPAYVGAGSIIYAAYFVPVIVFAGCLYRWDPFSLTHRNAKHDRTMLVATAACAAALLLTIALHPLSSPTPDGRLHIDFLDVGQGDSALVTFPNGMTMLVDGGGKAGAHTNATPDDEEPFQPDTRRVGEAVVSEFLWYRGYSRLDLIVPTHADADHIEGLVDVAKNFAVGSCLLARSPASSSNFRELNDVLRRRGVPERSIGESDHLEIGGVDIDVMNPPVSDGNDSSWDNNQSTVLRLTYGSRSFLLTGDMERQAEQRIMETGTFMAADVIKVPHHGSRTSSSEGLVAAVRPQLAVVSVGRTSPFGHPHREVVERWLASGAALMTTGSKGMISVSSDGTDLSVSTFLP